jgi:hypothetical protein
MSSESRVELMLGQRVRALNGRVIGRIEEIRAEISDETCYVTEYMVGTYAYFERLAAWSLMRSVLRLFRLAKKGGGYRVRWDQLDLSDAAQLRLRCKIEELSLMDQPHEF